MKTLRPLFSLALAIALLVLVILPSCNTGEMKDQITGLTAEQARLAGERDSLIQLLNQRNQTIEKNSNDLTALSTARDELTAKTKSLQSTLSSRTGQLKKAEETNTLLSSSSAMKEQENDSLMKEIEILLRKIAAIDEALAGTARTNEELAQNLKQAEEKRIADSTAAANKPVPVPPKEGGYINITEIGGAFGLGNTDPDFSRSIISINNVNGLVINKHFMTGIGVGLNFYNGGMMVPLYLDLRYAFKEGDFTPFIAADGGVLIYPSDLQSSGLFINPSFGLQKKISKLGSLHISTGIYLQEAPSGMRNTFINLKGGVSFRGK